MDSSLNLLVKVNMKEIRKIIREQLENFVLEKNSTIKMNGIPMKLNQETEVTSTKNNFKIATEKFLTESPQFENVYKAKKMFKEGFMSFENWIYVEGEKYLISESSKNLYSILKNKENASIKYISEHGNKEIYFIFKVHKTSIVPNNIIIKEI